MQFINTFNFYQEGNQPIRKYPSRPRTLSGFETGSQGNALLLKSRWPFKSFNRRHPPTVTSSGDLTPETTFVFRAFIRRKVSSRFVSKVNKCPRFSVIWERRENPLAGLEESNLNYSVDKSPNKCTPLINLKIISPLYSDCTLVIQGLLTCWTCHTTCTVKHIRIKCRAFAVIRKRFFKMTSLTELFENVKIDDVLSF